MDRTYVMRLFRFVADYLILHVGALVALKEEAAEHDLALKGLKKAKDSATKVTD